MRTAAPHLGKLCKQPDNFSYKYEKFINSVGLLFNKCLLVVYKYWAMCQLKINSTFNLKEHIVSVINITNATVTVYMV